MTDQSEMLIKYINGYVFKLCDDILKIFRRDSYFWLIIIASVCMLIHFKSLNNTNIATSFHICL